MRESEKDGPVAHRGTGRRSGESETGPGCPNKNKREVDRLNVQVWANRDGSGV